MSLDENLCGILKITKAVEEEVEKSFINMFWITVLFSPQKESIQNTKIYFCV